MDGRKRLFKRRLRGMAGLAGVVGVMAERKEGREQAINLARMSSSSRRSYIEQYMEPAHSKLGT